MCYRMLHRAMAFEAASDEGADLRLMLLIGG
jgi:hypothetical protein